MSNAMLVVENLYHSSNAICLISARIFVISSILLSRRSQVTDHMITDHMSLCQVTESDIISFNHGFA